MKQDLDANSGVSETSGTPNQQVQPIKPAKPAKNLYEPYITPPILYEAVRWLSISVFNITSRLHVRDISNLPRFGPFIIVSNHLSWTDIPLIAMPVRRKVVYMAKEEYFSSKLAWLVRFLGAFPVKRGEADRQALRAAEEQLKRGNIVVIFPEGTRSRTHTIAQAHSGMGLIALRSGVPVVPVAIWGSQNALKKFHTPITVCYGEPIVLKPKDKKITREDIDEATNLVMHKIAEMLPPEYRGVYARDQISRDITLQDGSPP